jgi:hypothetical protein
MAMNPRLLRPKASGFRYQLLRQGLVAYWPLNETATSGDVTAIDNSGRGNDLTSNNSVLSTAGKVGNARQFASANTEYLDRASNADLQFGDGNWTLSAWGLTTRTTTGFQHLVGKDQSGGREFGLRINTNSDNSNNRPTFFIQYTDGTSLLLEPGGNKTNANFVNLWWHWVVTHNSGTVTLYENGSVFGTASRAAGKAFATSNTPFNIGRRSFSSFFEYWDGAIDEVAKWNRALSAGEVSDLYNAGNGIDLSQRS